MLVTITLSSLLHVVFVRIDPLRFSSLDFFVEMITKIVSLPYKNGGGNVFSDRKLLDLRYADDFVPLRAFLNS